MYCFNAFFYTLVSTDTKEMFFSAKRQQYLVDQGYTFKVIQDLVDRSEKSAMLLKSKQQELDLLACIVEDGAFEGHQLETSDDAEDKAIKRLEGVHGDRVETDDAIVPKRRTSNISNLSGSTGTVYTEMSRKGSYF